MIFALAGRRIDAPDAVRDRFPSRNVVLVRQRIEALFRSSSGRALVCSAACGADLLALEAAGRMGWNRRVVLPFDRQRFRGTSVTDRPGEWGALYDRILDEVQATGDLLVEGAPAGGNGFEFAGMGILKEAARLSQATGEDHAAILVWDGVARGPGDMTEYFAKAAKERGFPLLEVNTLE